MSAYDPNSNDAMFARIETELKALNENFTELKTQFVEQIVTLNTRVTDLEHDKWYQRGAAFVIGLVGVGAWEWAKSKLFHGS